MQTVRDSTLRKKYCCGKMSQGRLRKERCSANVLQGIGRNRCCNLTAEFCGGWRISVGFRDRRAADGDGSLSGDLPPQSPCRDRLAGRNLATLRPGLRRSAWRQRISVI